jgi:capsular polysaccharide biosynthesis protein
VQSGQEASSGTGNSPYIETQAVVAGSSTVLSDALPRVSPGMSLQTLRTQVSVVSLTDSILSVSASGATAARAETIANAVAGSYVGYVTSGKSLVGYVPAKILQKATSATGLTLPEQAGIDSGLGGLAGAIAGYLIALAIGRNDRRLIERGAMANSIGAPVLASVPVTRPSDPASWAKLLEEYAPGPVHEWALRNMLQQLGLDTRAASGRANAGDRASGKPVTLTVLSLSSDRKAIALGPQLAAIAASLGISTSLIVGPQQDTDTAATLRTACAATPQAAGGKPLQLLASDGQLCQEGSAFTVVVTVIDRQSPRLTEEIPAAVTVLGISSGAVTADDLARAATAAAANGREIFGILVADPDPADQTTGRIPRMVPPTRRSMPTRVKDVPTEIRR